MVMNKLPAHPPVFILTPSQGPTLIDPIIPSYSTIISLITASACLYFYQQYLSFQLQSVVASLSKSSSRAIDII
jgi:hypothetical protein